jgi:hypothetical protein
MEKRVCVREETRNPTRHLCPLVKASDKAKLNQKKSGVFVKITGASRSVSARSPFGRLAVGILDPIARGG